MRMSSVFLAGALATLAGPSEAAQCTRFLHSAVPFALEFVGGRPGTPVTSWPTLLVGIKTGPYSRFEPEEFVRSDCGPQGYICYRNAADPTDTFVFKVEVHPEDPDGGTLLLPIHEAPKAAYFAACQVLDEIAREDAKRGPSGLPR